MAIFDYKCADCAHVFEKIAHHTDVTQPCKVCGGIAHKQVSAPAHVDGGFYGAEERADTNARIEKLERLSGLSQGGH